MSEIQTLIEKLSEVDTEIISKPKKGAVNDFLENIIGPSVHAKKQERKRIRILQNKKVMLINAFPVPNSGQELIALGNLAVSCYRTSDIKNEKEAWKNKMIMILNKLNKMVILDQEENLADEYLFLSNEIEEVTAKGNKWLRLFGR